MKRKDRIVLKTARAMLVLPFFFRIRSNRGDHGNRGHSLRAD